jgi:hypothetical protein
LGVVVVLGAIYMGILGAKSRSRSN